MLDLPGIIEGAKDGKGRGRQVISTARTCNLILIVLDCLKPLTHKKVSKAFCGMLTCLGVTTYVRHNEWRVLKMRTRLLYVGCLHIVHCMVV